VPPAFWSLGSVPFRSNLIAAFCGVPYSSQELLGHFLKIGYDPFLFDINSQYFPRCMVHFTGLGKLFPLCM
jgi:hypothetical protein